MDGTAFGGSAPIVTTNVCFPRKKINEVENCSLNLLKSHDRKLLATAENVLSKEFCSEIISLVEEVHPLSVIDKCTAHLKSKFQYCIEDSEFSMKIWERLNPLVENLLQTTKLTTQPLGFDVRRGEWSVHGLSEIITISKLMPIERKTFSVQRDAQYCRNNDERSFLSVVIYLNDDLEGFGHKFYFLKESDGGYIGKATSNGMTLKEEVDIAGGLENGYDVLNVVSSAGNAVFYSHDILYDAHLQNNPKWILKTNLIVSRKINEYGVGLVDGERDDYAKCIEYFKMGLSYEAKGLAEQASECHEKALSLRYSYPRNILETEAVDEYAHDMFATSYFPDIIWYSIFDFLSGKDIENVVKAFNDLFNLQRSWEFQRYRKSTRACTKHFPFIPTVETEPGTITRFKFSDAFFFHENIEACIRVAAMYSSCLMGRKNKDNVEFVRLNADTNEVYGLALESLLTDTFLDLSFFGLIFAVNKQNSDEKTFSEKLHLSVDRSYMLLRHNSQFTGINLSDKMTVKMKWPQVTDDEIVTAIEERRRFEMMCEAGEKCEIESRPRDKDFIAYRKKSMLYYFKRSLTKKLTPRNLVMIDYEGGITKGMGSFPVMIKDLLRYRNWESFCHSYEGYNLEWLQSHLLWENKVILYISLCYWDGDGEFVDELNDLSSAKELYTKCLIDVCDEKAGMSAAVVSISTRPLNFVEGVICFSSLPFEDRLELFRNKEILSSIKSECYNHLVFDFNNHFMQVERMETTKDDPIFIAREHDCIFYNSIYDSFRKTELLGLSSIFDYVVEINPYDEMPRKERWSGRPSSVEFDDPYESNTVLNFELQKCFNLQDFSTVNHIHIIGGTNAATQEVHVWAVYGGIVAV